MDKVKDIHEAMEWFLRNRDKKVLCIAQDGTEKEVCCYPEAEEFFETKT